MEKEQVTISFHSIHYEIENRISPWVAKEKKEILCGLR